MEFDLEHAALGYRGKRPAITAKLRVSRSQLTRYHGQVRIFLSEEVMRQAGFLVGDRLKIRLDPDGRTCLLQRLAGSSEEGWKLHYPHASEGEVHSALLVCTIGNEKHWGLFFPTPNLFEYAPPVIAYRGEGVLFELPHG